MKVLIIGKSGQLANELIAEAPAHIDALALGRNDVNIISVSAFTDAVTRLKPDVIINASAYTAVDKAETDIESAYALNKTAVEVLAQVAKEQHIRLLHVSTDFIFDGQSNRAYKVDDTASPQSIYGASKLAGEQAIQAISPENSAIIRTSWVYSNFGNNFVKTMLRLMSEKEELGVVADQIGCPTYAKTLATFLWILAEKDSIELIYHWSDAGVASWYDFAQAIQEVSVELGLLNKQIPINPIPSSAYPTPAERPVFSLLNCSLSTDTLKPIHWRKQLKNCLQNFN
mgnify:CR=1 FL=1